MTYLSNGVQGILEYAFVKNDLLINVKDDCIVVKNSENQKEEKIKQIVESVDFCPLISKNQLNGNFVFTIVPYKIPNFFIDQQNIVESSNKFQMSLPVKCINGDSSSYLNIVEISRLLKDFEFADDLQQNNPQKDKWDSVNSFRVFVSEALNQGLSNIISRYVKEEHPIVEIGSGIGYSIPEKLSANTIRIQPSKAECQFLKKTIAEPIYHTDIEGLYNCLIKSGKKIPLFFALNVFDTMPAEARKIGLSQISKLQNSGDRILMMHDTNPMINVTIAHLETLYPEHGIFPYLLPNDSSKIFAVIVPLEFASFKPTENDFVSLTEDAVMNGENSQIQQRLHRLQNQYDLKVIAVEDFFTEQAKKDLEQTGYKTEAYYCASFSTGEPPQGISHITQDLVYKPVSGFGTIREWSLSDKNLLNGLAKKGLSLPSHLNESFLMNLRQKGEKIFCAEILVIEATKI